MHAGEDSSEAMEGEKRKKIVNGDAEVASDEDEVDAADEDAEGEIEDDDNEDDEDKDDKDDDDEEDDDEEEDDEEDDEEDEEDEEDEDDEENGDDCIRDSVEPVVGESDEKDDDEDDDDDGGGDDGDVMDDDGHNKVEEHSVDRIEFNSDGEVVLSEELTRLAIKAAKSAAKSLRLNRLSEKVDSREMLQRALDKRLTEEQRRTKDMEDQVKKKARRPRKQSEKSKKGGSFAETATDRRQAKIQERKKQGLGKKWHNFVGQEEDDDLKNDISAIRMRGYIDPKRFYKNAPIENPEAVQIGTVVESAGEFYSSRIPKKKRQRTFVDEILADESVRSYTKKKLVQRQEEKNRGKRNLLKNRRRKKLPAWAQQ